MEERKIIKIMEKVRTKRLTLDFPTKGSLSGLVGMEGKWRNEWEMRKWRSWVETMSSRRLALRG